MITLEDHEGRICKLENNDEIQDEKITDLEKKDISLDGVIDKLATKLDMTCKNLNNVTVAIWGLVICLIGGFISLAIYVLEKG